MKPSTFPMLRAVTMALVLLGAAQAAQADVEVTVKITGLKSERGVVRASLFSEKQQEQFPTGAPLLQAQAKAASAGVTLSFRVPAAGRYAIAAMQDENDNGKMDVNFLGIPTEPRGNSGEHSVLKPDFAKSSFVVAADRIELQIQLH